MTKCIAEPLGRKDIRKMAATIRKIEGSYEQLYFDVVHFFENTLPQLKSGFCFQVKSVSEMGECHGLTFPDRNEIWIREDVYLRACEDSGRDRLTMAHELFHWLQHEKNNISFARTTSGNIAVYRDPEWQADAFGGELLVPHHLIDGMTTDEIVERCKVSKSAASYQLKKH